MFFDSNYTSGRRQLDSFNGMLIFLLLCLYRITLANVHFLQCYLLSGLIVPPGFDFSLSDSLFYCPIWIAMAVSKHSKHFLKVSNFIFQVLVVGAHSEHS